MGGGICLSVSELQNIVFDSSAVATGCSLGVDSFSTIEKYTSADCPEGYRLTHLTFFNAGSYGSNNLDKARSSYNHDLKLVKNFANETGLPVVEIETNFAVLYENFPWYSETGFMRNMSVILSMQKLFKRYLYASSYQVNDLRHGWGNYFYIVSQLLSTSNTNITITYPIQSRVEKTKVLLNNVLSYRYLNVCWGYLRVNKGDTAIEKVKEEFINCCRCDKCLRTMLTIDILGYKDKYSDIFDVKHYESEKPKYIGKVIGLKHRDIFCKELNELISKEQFPIPFKSRIYAIGYRFGLNYLISKLKSIRF